MTSFDQAPSELLPPSWLSRPLEIDVGCHKGKFLIGMATRYPDVNFLGIELKRRRAEKTQGKICRLGLRNATVLHGDSREALDRLPDACADGVHILFPDPWPKRRHETRRLVRIEFLREISRILKDEGILRLVTDDVDYMRAMELHAAGIACFRRVAENGRDYPASEFQIKFLSASRPVHALLLKRAN